MAAVPIEMIEEILVRLAAKSLLRFKCVCRRWRGLIQSQRFIDHHYSHDSNQGCLVFGRGEYVEGVFEEGHGDRLLLPYFGKKMKHHMGGVNGLLCEVSISGDIVLLNPATHKVKRVPTLPCVGQVPISELSFGFGFGFDSLCVDYKIVVLRRRAGEFAWVYNSSRDCWKLVEVVGYNNPDLNGAFLNGVCYWVVEKGGVNIILAFDMMSEKFREIKAPPHVREPHGVVRVASIATYGDSIAIMVWFSGYHLWVMGKQGVWSSISRFDSDCRHCWWMGCVWKNELLFRNTRNRSFILVDGTTQKVTSVAQYFDDIHIPRPFCYKESLVSIKGEQDV